MVDSTKGIGSVQNLTQPERPQPTVKKRDEADEVEKKKRKHELEEKKKLSPSEAEQTARDTRDQLQKSKKSLSNNRFDETV